MIYWIFLLLGLVIENLFKPVFVCVCVCVCVYIYIYLKPSYLYSAHFCGFLDSFAGGGNTTPPPHPATPLVKTG